MSRHARTPTRPNLIALGATLGAVGLLVTTALVASGSGDGPSKAITTPTVTAPSVSVSAGPSTAPASSAPLAPLAKKILDPYALPAAAVQPEPCPVPHASARPAAAAVQAAEAGDPVDQHPQAVADPARTRRP